MYKKTPPPSLPSPSKSNIDGRKRTGKKKARPEPMNRSKSKKPDQGIPVPKRKNASHNKKPIARKPITP